MSSSLSSSRAQSCTSSVTGGTSSASSSTSLSESSLISTLAGLDASILNLHEGRARFAAFRKQVTAALGELNNDASLLQEEVPSSATAAAIAPTPALALNDLGNTNDENDSFLAAAASTQRSTGSTPHRTGSDSAALRLRRLADGLGASSSINVSSPLTRAKNDLEAMLRTLDNVRVANGGGGVVTTTAATTTKSSDAIIAARHGGATILPPTPTTTSILLHPLPIYQQSTREHAVELLNKSLSNMAALQEKSGRSLSSSSSSSTTTPPPPLPLPLTLNLSTFTNSTSTTTATSTPPPPPPPSPSPQTLNAQIAEATFRAATADAKSRAATAEAALALLTSRITQLELNASASERRETITTPMRMPTHYTPPQSLMSDELFASHLRTLPISAPYATATTSDPTQLRSPITGIHAVETATLGTARLLLRARASPMLHRETATPVSFLRETLRGDSPHFSGSSNGPAARCGNGSGGEGGWQETLRNDSDTLQLGGSISHGPAARAAAALVAVERRAEQAEAKAELAAARAGEAIAIGRERDARALTISQAEQLRILNAANVATAAHTVSVVAHLAGAVETLGETVAAVAAATSPPRGDAARRAVTLATTTTSMPVWKSPGFSGAATFDEIQKSPPRAFTGPRSVTGPNVWSSSPSGGTVRNKTTTTSAAAVKRIPSPAPLSRAGLLRTMANVQEALGEALRVAAMDAEGE